MGLSKAAKRTLQRTYEMGEVDALRVLCSEQQRQIVDMRRLIGFLRRRTESPLAVDAVDPVLASSVEPSTRDEKKENLAAGKESE